MTLLNHAVSGSNLEILQLCPGALDAEVLHTSIGDLSVDHGTVNLPLRVFGTLDPFRFGIGLFDPGSQATFNGNDVDSSRVLYCMPGGELNGHLQSLYGWTSLVVPSRWIESLADTSRSGTAFRLPTRCKAVEPAPAKLEALRMAAASIVTTRFEGGDREWMAMNLRNALGEVLSVLDRPLRKEVSCALAHFSTARKAERHMRERLGETLCVDDICRALRVSRRYLEYAFSDAFGTSPSRYLRLLRLHEVRRRLRSAGPGTTVTREALGLGFNHLSLFSGQYKRTFGESPSETLAATEPRAHAVRAAQSTGTRPSSSSANAPISPCAQS